MTTPLRKIKSDDDKLTTIIRRINGNTRGLGFFASVDAFKKLHPSLQSIVLGGIKDKTMKIGLMAGRV